MRWLEGLAGKTKQTDAQSAAAQMTAAYDAAGRGDHEAALAIWGPLAHAGVPRDAVAAFALLLRSRKGGGALAQPFFEVVRGTLSPIELQEAEFRATAPLPGAAA